MSLNNAYQIIIIYRVIFFNQGDADILISTKIIKIPWVNLKVPWSRLGFFSISALNRIYLKMSYCNWRIEHIKQVLKEKFKRDRKHWRFSMGIINTKEYCLGRLKGGVIDRFGQYKGFCKSVQETGTLIYCLCERDLA